MPLSPCRRAGRRGARSRLRSGIAQEHKAANQTYFCILTYCLVSCYDSYIWFGVFRVLHGPETLKSTKAPKTSYLACLGWVHPLGGPQIGSNRNALDLYPSWLITLISRRRQVGCNHQYPYRSSAAAHGENIRASPFLKDTVRTSPPPKSISRVPPACA